MGIFGDDKLQDARLDAIEAHLRVLTETVQNNQIDLTTCGIAILALQAQVDEKISASEVDPAISDLNAGLAKARIELERVSAAAADDWADLQRDLQGSFARLRAEVNAAREKVTG